MPDCSSPSLWLAFVQPFATVLLGLGAAALAYRQWLTANEKLRFDLFNPRNEAAKEIDDTIMQLQIESSENFNGLIASGVVVKAIPLFGGRKARAQLQQLADLYVHLWRESRRLKRLKPDQPGFDAAIDGVDNLEQEAIKAHRTLREALEPYLTFHARDYRWR